MSASLVIYANGSIDEVVLPGRTLDDMANLKVMYAAIGCRTVDVVELAPGLDMWVDDDGIANGAEINVLATMLAQGYGLTHQPYLGTALLCGADEEGCSTNLSDEAVTSLKWQLKTMASK